MCQETSPESSEGPIPSSPSRMSPLPPNPLEPPDLDLESQPPIIHDIVTSSPSDYEHLGATPFVTNLDLGAPLDIPVPDLPPAEPEEYRSASLDTETPIAAEPVLDTPADIGASFSEESPVFTPEPEINIPTETLTAADPRSYVEADVSLVHQSTEPPSLVIESPITDSPAPETVGSYEAVEESAVEKEEEETGTQYEQEEEGMGLCYMNSG